MTMTSEQALIVKLLDQRIYWLHNQIRAQNLLSQPVGEGHWRWADLDSSGYHRKSDERLAADRERATERVVQYRAEMQVALSARHITLAANQ